MAPKRPRDDDSTAPSKKQKKGFSVGPANLPDGTYKRKVQKIKKDLIHKAKLKKEYAKIKSREQPTTHRSVYDRDDDENNDDDDAEQPEQNAVEPPEITLDPHPDRQRRLEEPSPEPERAPHVERSERRRKQPRMNPYQKETELANKRKAEAEARQKARQEADKERQRKSAERERFRKQMAKARAVGPDGKKKLGRESTVLLEKVKRMVGST